MIAENTNFELQESKKFKVGKVKINISSNEDRIIIIEKKLLTNDLIINYRDEIICDVIN